MHGSGPQRPKRLTPSQQCAKALDLIQPASERRAGCEDGILTRIRLVSAILPRKPYRARDVERIIGKLREAEIAIADMDVGLLPWLRDEFLLDRIKCARESLEGYTAVVRQDNLRRGGNRQDPVKLKAAHFSRVLLEEFGHRPTLTVDGVWHRLAATLCGYAMADLFDFNYLRLTQRRLLRQRAKDTPQSETPTRTPQV
jgi:hypothetical protein